MQKLLNRFFGGHEVKRKVGRLYGAIMTQARAPFLFEHMGVQDQFENRFELLTLHMFMVLERLKEERQTGQLLVEYMVNDLDRTCREMGVGDVGVVKRMKDFMSGFYGRIRAYNAALRSPDEKDMLRALDKNLYANVATDIGKLNAMRDYIAMQTAHLAGQDVNDLKNGTISFISSRHAREGGHPSE